MSHVHVCSSSRRRWHAALHGDSGSHRADVCSGPPACGEKTDKAGDVSSRRNPPPARAGKTDIAARDTQIEEDHPRVCGENDSIMF